MRTLVLILVAAFGLMAQPQTTPAPAPATLPAAVPAPQPSGNDEVVKHIYDLIDYGGREVEDVYLSGQWMLETYPFLDAKRVGVIGWSHGGLISLMNVFTHPQTYAVAYAGVPVSDLVERLGYEPAGYQSLY